MATAERRIALRVEQPPDRVLLDLSEDEAETLLTLTGHVGGDSRRGRRGHTDSIAKALTSAGVRYLPPGGVVKNEKTTGSVYFYYDDGTLPPLVNPVPQPEEF